MAAVAMGAEIVADAGAAAAEADWRGQRWVEVENAMVALESERDALKVELQELRCLAPIAARPSGPSGVCIAEGEPVKELQLSLAAAKALAEERLTDLVVEREQSAKLAEELKQQSEARARLSKEKFLLQADKHRAESELLPVQRERDRLKQTSERAEQVAHEAQRELEVLSDERRKVLREMQCVRRELEDKFQAALADGEFYKQVAEEARVQQERLRRQLFGTEQQLKERTEDFAAQRAALEAKVALRDEELAREGALREAMQKQIAQLEGEKSQAIEAEAEGVKEQSRLRDAATAVGRELSRLRRAHEELLRTRIPGAEDTTEPPEGFASLAELLDEVSAAREQLEAERQAKIELQEVLREVEREVRARYPALLAQRDDLERLHRVSDVLSHENSALLKRVRELERSKRDSEAETKDARKSVQILEVHAKDMATQCAVLVHENRKLSGSLQLARYSVGELAALEEERAVFRSVQELTSQNETLRLALLKLQASGDGCLKAELEVLQEEREQEAEEWKKHLALKAEQMAELAATVERLTRELDEVGRTKLKQQTQPEVPFPTSSPSVKPEHKELALTDQFNSVRDEFAKSLEALKLEIKDARGSELKVRQNFTTVQAQVEYEKGRCRDMEARLKTMESKLEEERSKERKLEKQIISLQDRLQEEEADQREKGNTLAHALKEKDRLEISAQADLARIQMLEQTCACLQAEQKAQLELVSELRSRVLEQAETYKAARHDLEVRFHGEERLLKEKLDASDRRQKDLQRLVDEYFAAKIALEADAQTARDRIKELDASQARLEKQLAEQVRAVEVVGNIEGAVGTSRGVVDAAEAQLRRSETPRENDPQMAKLQQQLKYADERAKEHRESTARWQALLEEREVELRQFRARLDDLQSQLGVAADQKKICEEEAATARLHEQELEAKILALNTEAVELRAAAKRHDAALAAARLESEEKLRVAEAATAQKERESAANAEKAEEMNQRYHDIAIAHARDMTELDEAKGRQASLESRIKELQQENLDFKTSIEDARVASKAEVETSRTRILQYERNMETLKLEVQRYREGLLALSEKRSEGEGSEAAQRVAAELRRARERGEVQRQEVELEKVRLEGEAKLLRADVLELQRRLDLEQQQVLQLQAEIRREHRAAAKLGQMSLLESENNRLAESARALAERLEKCSSDLDGERAKHEPLERKVLELQRKEQDWERSRVVLEARADEWKSSYDEIVLRFDARHVAEFKTLKDEQVKWQAEKQDMSTRFDKLQQQLREHVEKAAQTGGLKSQNESLKKELADVRAKFEQAKTERLKLSQDFQAKDTERNRIETLHKLCVRRIDELEKEMSDLKADKQKREDELRKAQEDVRKASDDLRKSQSLAEQRGADASSAQQSRVAAQLQADKALSAAQLQADKALGLAADYQLALEAMVTKQKQAALAASSQAAQAAQAAHATHSAQAGHAAAPTAPEAAPAAQASTPAPKLVAAGASTQPSPQQPFAAAVGADAGGKRSRPVEDLDLETPANVTQQRQAKIARPAHAPTPSGSLAVAPGAGTSATPSRTVAELSPGAALAAPASSANLVSGGAAACTGAAPARPMLTPAAPAPQPRATTPPAVVTVQSQATFAAAGSGSAVSQTAGVGGAGPSPSGSAAVDAVGRQDSILIDDDDQGSPAQTLSPIA